LLFQLLIFCVCSVDCCVESVFFFQQWPKSDCMPALLFTIPRIPENSLLYRVYQKIVV
jgi:hypothetical protein